MLPHPVVPPATVCKVTLAVVAAAEEAFVRGLIADFCPCCDAHAFWSTLKVAEQLLNGEDHSGNFSLIARQLEIEEFMRVVIQPHGAQSIAQSQQRASSTVPFQEEQQVVIRDMDGVLHAALCEKMVQAQVVAAPSNIGITRTQKHSQPKDTSDEVRKWLMKDFGLDSGLSGTVQATRGRHLGKVRERKHRVWTLLADARAQVLARTIITRTFIDLRCAYDHMSGEFPLVQRSRF